MINRDFIFTSLQSWDIPIGSNAIDIAKEIAKDNRVLYVNSPLDIMTLLRNKPTPETKHRLSVLKKQNPPLRCINENLWVLDLPFVIGSVNLIPDGFLFDVVNKYNNKKIHRYVQKVAKSLGFSDIIHFADNDVYRSLYAKEYLKSAISVYYRRDNLHPYSYWKKHIGRLEPKLIGKSDVVVCNSSQLADYAAEFNQKVYDIGQGVDLSAYDSKKVFRVPEKLSYIPEPRIGYIGDINSQRLDADLLYDLAKNKPGYSFVMIGGEDKVFAMHQLHQLSNVYFIGKIPKNEVPEYMSALQVCLNPQALNEITIGNYPRKVDEYLALGKPVVATKTDAMDLFKEHVYLASGINEYTELVETALAENSEAKKQARIKFAHSHSWENNVNNIYTAIKTVKKYHHEL